MNVRRTRWNSAGSVLLCALAWTACGGCSSTNYLVKRSEPFNPLSSTLHLFSWLGPRPSDRSDKLLRRYDLNKLDTPARLDALRREIEAEPLPEKLYAYAELAYLEARREHEKKNLKEAVDLYGAAVAHAYWYLFDPENDVLRNPYDPQFRGACDLYNESLEGVLRIAQEENQLRPGMQYHISTGGHEFHVQVVLHGPWHAEDIERFEFVSDYEIKGLANRHHTYGLGVPLIAVRRPHADEEPAERYYPPGLSFAVTAFLRVSAGLDECRNNKQSRPCVLELHDTLNTKDIVTSGRRLPLETDLTAPLAYFLDNKQFNEKTNVATVAFFLPETAKSLQGMYMVEPYDPRKIPVLMVHGLWSSPTTWMEMFNDLRSFPEVREQFQFWFYLYPTGQPFWISARQLRDDLAEMRNLLDPDHNTPALDQMVLVGHSMGGLVSKLQTIDSRDDYWNLLSDRPFKELKAEDETRYKLARTVFFQPNPSVRRVVTIGTPHRGSDFANDYTRWLGRQFIRLPEMMVRASQGLTRNNPDFFRDTELLTISTSLDSLSPNSPVLPLMLNSPKAPWTKYHNIIGLIPEQGIVGTLAAGSDGIVSYNSAHLDDVESEITVDSDHVNVHRHPRAILEVRRILLEHRDAALAELGVPSQALPVSYQVPEYPAEERGGAMFVPASEHLH